MNRFPTGTPTNHPSFQKIPLDASIIQYLLSGRPFRNRHAKSHDRCYNSCQWVENVFCELVDALNIRVGAWGVETKNDPRRPVDVRIQKAITDIKLSIETLEKQWFL